MPEQGRAPRIESRAPRIEGGPGQPSGPGTSAGEAAPRAAAGPEPGTRKGTPTRGTDVPPGVRKRGGFGAWARRLAGGRDELPGTGPGDPYDTDGDAGAAEFLAASLPPQAPESWPDPATLLLTALGPGPRLWERGPGHPETLTVRLGTADRAAPDGSGLVPAVPVTAGLREVGSLGLAGPRARLAGLARSVVAQLAALHSPDALDIVLISADRSRTVEERTAEWSWLGWLPHLRPTHGQDCRLLLAYDREQATARTDELLRRLEDQLAETGGARGAYDKADRVPVDARGGARRPSWARDEDPTGADRDFEGPFTVLVVDGDPGGADVREAVLRLTHEGARAGIHVVCLAETVSASPASPVTETYEAACEASPAFRECGAVALLSGDVATALRLMRVGSDGPVGHGTVAAVDAVSLAWAERFARALAPLRTDGTHADRHARVSAPLPQAARLLDELGLARATPASLMARWADAADDTEALGGRGRAVLGAGPRGPVAVDLPAEGPHLLIEGPPGSGRTELLRAIAASLAAAERPDRLGIVLMDGRDSTGGHGAGQGAEGLRVCTDLPHVTTHLTANDPVRMREFAQSLSAELKRRAELLGLARLRGVAHARRGVGPDGRPAHAQTHPGSEARPGLSLRLRRRGSRRAPQFDPAAAPGGCPRTDGAGPPLARLVVIIDDLDALLSPALGSPGRPAAGSVVRALEAVAREGDRLGVHLVAAAADDGRTATTELGRAASLRISLDPVSPGADEPAPAGAVCPLPTVASLPSRLKPGHGPHPPHGHPPPHGRPLEWRRMGDPRPAAPSANSATAPRTWPCWPARWSGRRGRWRRWRCRRCCSSSTAVRHTRLS
ncbi:FtsK/SpoIIIE domain-containing protein [Streptomyces sp. S1D4-11]